MSDRTKWVKGTLRILTSGMIAMGAVATAQTNDSVFGGKPYSATWRSLKKRFIQANIDSRGKVSVVNKEDRSAFVFGLDVMNRDCWATAEVENVTAVLDESAIAPGRTGNGMRFERFPVDLGASSRYRFASPMSIAVWIKPESLGGFIVANGYTRGPNFAGEDHLYSLEIRPDGSLWFELTDTADRRHIHNPPEIKLTTNAWQHVAATYDGTAMRVYVNGKEAGAGLEEKNIRIRDRFEAGRPLLVGDGCRAVMDDIRLYGRGLSAKEVTALAAGVALAPAEGNLDQGQVARWDFDAKEGPFWNLSCREEFRVKGLISGGTEVNIAMTLSVSGDTIQCRYEASAPLMLVGSFPAMPEANWFRSKDEKCQDIQGELWGTYDELKMFDSVEYTHLERRSRLAFGKGSPLVVRPCESPWAPATFTLASTQEGTTNTIAFTFQSLDPAQAPLAAAQTPIVTKPFDRKKLRVPDSAVPVKLAARRGGEPIFKRGEELAFRLALDAGARKAVEGQKPEARCVDAMTEAVVETVVTTADTNGMCELTLKAVKPGPYRIELWTGEKMLGDGEFVVVGPIEQRKIGPLDKDVFKLREVDRIECAEDNGRHEFYAITP
ncbi:MAG: LamG domain-containing protein, partial [Kiritimatiellae bacterium]|nr:LamG domain-containing protein [Kiritimatiellia bacterium]